MYNWTLVTPPTIEPVALGAVKTHLRLQGVDAFDAKLTSDIKAAREYLERRTSRAFLSQTRKQYFDHFQYEYELIGKPINSISSFTYTERDGDVVTWGASNYALQVGTAYVYTRADVTIPTVELLERNAIAITYTCGWATEADVPERIKQAVLLLVGAWFSYPEGVVIGQLAQEPKVMPYGIEDLISSLVVL